MDILYLSNSGSDEKFEYLLKSGMTTQLPQAQKYNKLLMEGISECIDGEVYALCAIPVNSETAKRTFFKRETEHRGGINYIYGGFVNLPIFRQLTRILGAVREIRRRYKKSKNCVIIVDILSQSLDCAARICGKKYGIPVVGIVTDVPGLTSGAQAKTYSSIKRKIAEFAGKNSERNMAKHDAFLLLTEAMNAVVNKNSKPYIVLEGHSDNKMANIENSLSGKSSPKVMMYAGGIHKEYGIERLVNAFLRGGFDDWELHIYGDGNYKSELTELSEKVSNVKYFGIRPNSEVVKNQLSATLLVNPRPTDAEYVKYSFPSKTMECMASGTPLLTTRLPGMPKEYYPYVYLFDDETEKGMLETLKVVLSKDSAEHHALGEKAKAFVMTEKTNVAQAKKLIDFIKTLR